MSKVHLYISPHLDDAVFSCSGQMMRDYAQGDQVIILTVFSGSNGIDSARYDTRKKEDVNAASLLHADIYWLDLPDAPYRHNYYNSYSRLLFGRHSGDDAAFVQSISEKIRAICNKTMPSKIIAPLGVGTHIDHRICFEAVNLLSGCNTFYFEDRPYAFVSGSIQKRLNSIAAEHNLGEIDESRFNSSLHLMPWADQKFSERGNIKIPHPRLMAKSKLFLFSELEKLKVLKVWACYDSQFVPFWGSEETIQKFLDEHNDFHGISAAYSERLWTLKESEELSRIIYI